ncbi:hypothetical protein DRN74_02125 [Candidatus Micrarchaeota archaeon]|nr:MAG: hypothetical protein DRN74_02125 [Candidatus Micrarchaeota archaeon]
MGFRRKKARLGKVAAPFIFQIPGKTKKTVAKEVRDVDELIEMERKKREKTINKYNKTWDPDMKSRLRAEAEKAKKADPVLVATGEINELSKKDMAKAVELGIQLMSRYGVDINRFNFPLKKAIEKKLNEEYEEEKKRRKLGF